MIGQCLYTRLKVVNPVLILSLTIMLQGTFHRVCPEYLNKWLVFLGVGVISNDWIQLAGRVLILIGGIGACVQYCRDPKLRRWSFGVSNTIGHH